jgi:branched-chain amino acid transport system ATP-binding protein
MANILEVRGLNASYGNVKVLQDIDLDVRADGITALLGANGAGKTTTLRAISSLMVRKSGQILFEGTEIAGKTTDEIARLGLAHIPDDRGTLADLTVNENLRIAGYARLTAPELRRVIERVFICFPRLRERSGQPAGLLSGGEQQMLAIGRTMMMKPRLLMLDEPSFGLAPHIVSDIFRMLKEINETDHISMLLVEQNADRALTLADHAYVLEVGRVVLSGPAGAVRQDDRVREAYLGTQVAS